MKTLRLIVKVPSYRQTGCDSWQDTTTLRTIDIPVRDDVATMMVSGMGMYIQSGYILPDDDTSRLDDGSGK